MRPILFSLAFLAVLGLVVMSCNDRDASMLSEPQTQLSAASGESRLNPDDPLDITFELSTKDGDGPWVTKTVKPVRWDGASKLESDVVYYFADEQEKLAALETVPTLLEAYVKMKEKAELEKGKALSSPKLAAWCDAYADAVAWSASGRVYGQCYMANDGHYDGGVLDPWCQHWYQVEQYYGYRDFYDFLPHETRSSAFYETCPGGAVMPGCGVMIPHCDTYASDLDEEICS